MKKIIVLTVALGVLVSCSKKKEENTKISQQATSQTSNYAETNFYFKLPLYKGGDIDLKNLAGNPVLVMFFTENCPYCQKAAPFIEKIHNKYSQKGLKVIGISVRPNLESAQTFAKEFNLTFDIAYNGRDVAKRYGISGVPFIYLLNKDHTLNKVWAGYDKSYEVNIDETVSKLL
ncbi:MAG: TlpA family protein disulfide reductase [Elusimicrobiales bacterium]|nr:TlpA family protein disulfide reductase [Elusimicrobiales bacterium]